MKPDNAPRPITEPRHLANEARVELLMLERDKMAAVRERRYDDARAMDVQIAATQQKLISAETLLRSAQ